MSVLELLGSSHHSWVAGYPWAVWAVQVPAWFHYLWLSIWRQVPPPVLFSPLRWMSVECATKDNSFWQKKLGCLTLLWFVGWRNTARPHLWKLYFAISTNSRVLWQHPFSIHLAFTCLRKALCGLKRWPKQSRTKRMMWLMDSDLVGLRPLAGAGLSLSDCSDLPIHQSDCDNAGALSAERQPWPGRRQSLYPGYHWPHNTFTSPYRWGSEDGPAGLREKMSLLDSNLRYSSGERMPSQLRAHLV